MFKLILTKSIKGRNVKRRCELSQRRKFADMAIAKDGQGVGRWYFLRKEYLLDAIKNADESIKEEIFELLKDEFIVEDLEDEDNLDDDVLEELEIIKKATEILKEDDEDDELESLNLDEIPVETIIITDEEPIEEVVDLDKIKEEAKELGVTVRSNSTKETLIRKIKEAKGE